MTLDFAYDDNQQNQAYCTDQGLNGKQFYLLLYSIAIYSSFAVNDRNIHAPNPSSLMNQNFEGRKAGSQSTTFFNPTMLAR